MGFLFHMKLLNSTQPRELIEEQLLRFIQVNLAKTIQLGGLILKQLLGFVHISLANSQLTQEELVCFL